MTNFQFPELNVKMDIARLTQGLHRLQREQIPFSLSQAMWETTALAKQRAQRSMRSKLDNPRPTTINAMRNWAPSKKQVYSRDAKVFFPRYLAQELGLQVYGGSVDTISPKDRTIITPVNATLDSFGNVQGLRGRNNVLKQARKNEIEKGIEYVEVRLGEEQQFGGLPAGLYERVGFGQYDRLLIMLFAYSETRNYRRIWEFDEIVLDAYRSHFPLSFTRFLTTNINRSFKRDGQVIT